MASNWFRSPGFIRLLHSSPDAPAVDVYANNMKVASNLSFKDLTGYLRLRSGRYNIEVFPAGRRMNPVLQENIVIRSGSISTASVIGRVRNLNLLAIEDPKENPTRDIAYIRAAHLSPNAPAVDIELNGRRVFRNLSYRDVTRHFSVSPGTYNLSIYIAGTDTRVLEIPNVVLQPGFYYTTFALGLVDEEPPLQTITSIDGLYRFIS
ncbi:DUF4397 domain-containing protein [Halonatronum saccharophilum]|uniref:DUF4397 domain-containing protein n=1 Tax=Halonatronum saccharophilum TaxID=150060 RepID=UPI0004811BC9|nr:DUF4397 domain-containing protein [Halonatronum saccharophilum]